MIIIHFIFQSIIIRQQSMRIIWNKYKHSEQFSTEVSHIPFASNEYAFNHVPAVQLCLFSSRAFVY